MEDVGKILTLNPIRVLTSLTDSRTPAYNSDCNNNRCFTCKRFNIDQIPKHIKIQHGIYEISNLSQIVSLTGEQW